jgi:hypothetical protein
MINVVIMIVGVQCRYGRHVQLKASFALPKTARVYILQISSPSVKRMRILNILATGMKTNTGMRSAVRSIANL